MCSFDLNAAANRNVNETVAGHKSFHMNFVAGGRRVRERRVLKTANRKSSRASRPACPRLESHNVP